MTTGPNADGADRSAVMVVDDEALVALFVADVVEELGYRVIGPVGSYDAALKAAEDDRPGIAIVDMTLGGGRSGLDLARELTARHGTAIVVLSGHGHLDADPGVKALGPAAVLQKPCMPNDIEKALRAAGGGGRTGFPGSPTAASAPTPSD